MIEKDGASDTAVPSRSAMFDGIALAGLAVVTIVFFWKIVLTNQVLSGIDLFAYFYPYRDFASEALRSGRLPQWNPYLFMGAPLLANSQVAVLYPLHWPLIWLSAPKQIAWSIVLHVWLAGAGVYVFSRRIVGLRPLGSFAGAAILALGGFLGAQVEHVNQLNASAWLPWLLICLERASGRPAGPRTRIAFVAGCAVISLTLLAGHTQAAYIVLAAAGCFSLLRGMASSTGQGRRRAVEWLRGPALLAAMAGVALLLSAGQLLPTLELSRLSVRSGGLEYREAVSFSLKPGEVLQAFFSPLAFDLPASTESVAYVGFSGLLLACMGTASVLRILHRRRLTAKQSSDSCPSHRFGLASALLACLGVFLALGAYNPVYYLLYRLVPGISLFRAPARWLLLYAFGMAVLAAIGLDWVERLQPSRKKLGRPLAVGATMLLLVELLLSGRQLAYSWPTAPAAYDSLRSATAHLLASSERGLDRFLSLSDIRFDPGDLGDTQDMFARDLSEDALYQLIVAAKMKEVLAYNLPLRYRLFSVDGYDGGLLPTSRYVTLERLFLKPEDIWPDGRLRQQLTAIPTARLLSLLNVRYVITDKLQDAWHEGVYYDLEAELPLGQTALVDLPRFEATQLGIVTYLTGTAELPLGAPVAEVVVEAGNEDVLAAVLRAGYDTAKGLRDSGGASLDRAVAIHHWRGNANGNDYLAIVRLEEAMNPSAIRIRSLLPEGRAAGIVLRGVSLIDHRTGTSTSVSIDPALKLVHSGDVKVYENRDVLPRAFVVPLAQTASSDADAISLLASPSFDPARQVILAEWPSAPGGQSLGGTTDLVSRVQILRYSPEHLELDVTLSRPGFLVLTDAYYPGWQAAVDGAPVPILRADVYFRAVPVDAGRHTVAFQFSPPSVRLGIGISGTAWIGWLLAFVVLGLQAGRRCRHQL